MDVGLFKLNNGLFFRFKDKDYPIIFPSRIWSKVPRNFREFFMDNYSFLKVVHLPIMFGVKNIRLNTAKPLFKKYFINMQMKDIPSMCYSDGTPPEKFLKLVKNAKFKFKKKWIKNSWLGDLDDDSCVISFSFGKDSLLTFAVAKELGLKSHLVTIEEEGAPIEISYKRVLSKEFFKELGVKLEKVYNKSMLMHDFNHFGLKNKYRYIMSHMITEYIFFMLPFVYNYSAKYILLGNEKSCNYYAIDKFGNKCYPVFDQSTEWILKINKMLMSLGEPRVFSFAEIVGDLAILKILYNRYPDIAKYQYSCFPDESSIIETKRWCCNCSKCARLYIMLKSLGINVRKVGMTKDMLREESKKYYPIFSAKIVGSLYDDIGVGREEQLYSFYLAYKRGVKGPLIDEFKSRYLELAKENEEKWYKKFFSVYSSSTIPTKLRKKVVSIYEEELGD